MPLILDPATHTPERLRKLANEQREGLQQMREVVASVPSDAMKDPGSFRTLRVLLQDAITTMDQLDSPTASPASVAAAANLGYSVMISAIDLMKSHSDVPKVPRAPPSAQGPP